MSADRFFIQDSITKLLLTYNDLDECELVDKEAAKHWPNEEDAKACLRYLTNERALPHGSFHPVPESELDRR